MSNSTLQEQLRIAIEENNREVVNLLLKNPKVDPSADNNYYIQRAAYNGHVEVVEILLQDRRVDPSVNNNFAMLSASQNNHLSVVESLLYDDRVDPNILHTSYSMINVASFSDESFYLLCVKLRNHFPADSKIMHWKRRVDECRKDL
jgi:ankyrin repeat protein